HERQRATEIGRGILERDAPRFEVSLKKFSEAEIGRAGAEFGFTKSEDVYAGLGYGKISARQILAKLVPPAQRTPNQARRFETRRRTAAARAPRPGSPILVRGFSDLLVYRAACCANVRNLLYEPDRRIDVAWAPTSTEPQLVKLVIHSDDNAGMLNAITNVISGQGSNIRNIGARTADGQATIDLAVDVTDARNLDEILAGLKSLSGVHTITRVRGSRVSSIR